MKMIPTTLLTCAWASTAHGALVITEVMSSSAHSGGAANGDWFELTNTGAASINLAGYYWDDDGAAGNDGALFPSITLNSLESIVIVNESAADLPAFIAAWGGGFVAYSEEEFSGPDTFSGLSGNGDQIEIWNADPNSGAADLVASAVFGEATDGLSFEWDGSGTDLGLSVAGENGAFVATNDGADPLGAGIDIASPGSAVIVPEPSALLLSLLGVVAAFRRRR